MKLPIFLITTACVLNFSLASSYHPKVKNVHSEIMSYYQQKIGAIPMMRSDTVHLECFNGFMPLINSLATKARDVSNGCVSIADFEKNMEMVELLNARLEIAAEVEEIQNSLTDCSNKIGLDYFLCLDDNAEINRKHMAIIKDKSNALMSDYRTKMNAIDDRERVCINNAIENAKNESDHAYIDLKACIKDGPVIQTQIGDKEESSSNSKNS